MEGGWGGTDSPNRLFMKGVGFLASATAKRGPDEHCRSSFPFHFVLSENNLKIISLPEKWQMLVLCSVNISLCFELPKNSAPRPHKA